MKYETHDDFSEVELMGVIEFDDVNGARVAGTVIGHKPEAKLLAIVGNGGAHEVLYGVPQETEKP
jgi:hypothetical protein